MTPSMKIQLAAVALCLIALVSAFLVACIGLYRMAGPRLAAIGSAETYKWHNNQGNNSYERHDYAAAIQEYSAMVTEKPDKQDGYFLRGMAEYKAHFYAATIQDYTIVLALLKTPNPFFYAPGSLAHSRFSTRAIPRSIHTDPVAATHYTRGIAYQAQGRLSLAVADFSAILERLPGEYDTLEARMSAYYDNKQYAQALADSNTLLRTHPQDQWAHCFRGKAEMSLGKYEPAFQDLAAAIHIAPHYETPYFVLSLITDHTHRYLPTLAILQQGVRANPGDIDLQGTCGWLQYEADQVPAAIVTDRGVLAQDPSMTWVRYNLALAYAVLEDTADAQRTYTQARAMSDQTSRASAKKDIEDALRLHPHSPALLQCAQQFAAGPH